MTASEAHNLIDECAGNSELAHQGLDYVDNDPEQRGSGNYVLDLQGCRSDGCEFAGQTIRPDSATYPDECPKCGETNVYCMVRLVK